MNELAGTEPVNVNGWKLPFDVGKQIQVPLQRQLRMVPALHQDLGAAERDGLFNLLIDFVMGDYVRILVSLDPVEGAELAVNIADVCIIDIAVHDIADDLVPATIIGINFGKVPASICERTQFLQGQLIEP